LNTKIYYIEQQNILDWVSKYIRFLTKIFQIVHQNISNSVPNILAKLED